MRSHQTINRYAIELDRLNGGIDEFGGPALLATPNRPAKGGGKGLLGVAMGLSMFIPGVNAAVLAVGQSVGGAMGITSTLGQSIVGGALFGAAAGAISTGSLKGALTGGLMGGIGAGLGGMAQGQSFGASGASGTLAAADDVALASTTSSGAAQTASLASAPLEGSIGALRTAAPVGSGAFTGPATATFNAGAPVGSGSFVGAGFPQAGQPSFVDRVVSGVADQFSTTNLANKALQYGIGQLAPKPDFDAGAFDQLSGIADKMTGLEDEKAAAYRANMPTLQRNAMGLVAQSDPNVLANMSLTDFNIGMDTTRQRRQAELAAAGYQPGTEAYNRAMRDLDFQSSQGRTNAYNKGLLSGQTQSMGMTTQAASLFPSASYGGAASVAGAAASGRAATAEREYNAQNQAAQDMTALFKSPEEYAAEEAKKNNRGMAGRS